MSDIASTPPGPGGKGFITSSPLHTLPRITIRVDDLTFVSGEAIAWPVTATLGATTPLLRRLERAAGETLADQLRVQEPLPVGSAVVTAAGALEVELLVSAVVSSDSEAVSRHGVRRALTSALQRATDWQIEHLVCAPFGLGAGNLDVEECAALMLEVMAAHGARARHPASIVIVVETDAEREAFEAYLPRGTT